VLSFFNYLLFAYKHVIRDKTNRVELYKNYLFLSINVSQQLLTFLKHRKYQSIFDVSMVSLDLNIVVNIWDNVNISLQNI